MAFEMRVLALVLAVSTQFQVTLPIGEFGLRVAASDLFLPIGLLYVAIWYISPRSHLEWRMPGVWLWLAAITAALLIALIVGRVDQGTWSSWALVNKFVGWAALASYFLLGGAFVRAGGQALRNELLTVFVVTAAVIAALNVLAMPILYPFYTLPFGIEFSRATGGLQNANAFGFLTAVAALLVLALRKHPHWLIPPLVAALWFTASRGAMLAFAAGLVCLLMLRSVRARMLGQTLALSIAVVICVTAATLLGNRDSMAMAESGVSPLGLSFTSERFDPGSEGVMGRREQVVKSLGMFVEAPFLGHGLGYFLARTGVSLHNSLLWLLVETGLLGVGAFVGFLAMALRSIYIDREDPFLTGMVAVAIAFAVMSVTGEFLYQRHLWLLLGLALVRPEPLAKP